jgi:hypothetical protein
MDVFVYKCTFDILLNYLYMISQKNNISTFSLQPTGPASRSNA